MRIPSIILACSCLAACGSNGPKPFDDSKCGEGIDLLEGGESAPNVIDPAPLASADRPVLVPSAGFHSIAGGMVALRCSSRDPDAGESEGAASTDCEVVVGDDAGKPVWSVWPEGAAEDMPASDVFTVYAPLVVELTGDDRPELVLRWRVIGDSIPAIGSQEMDWLAVVSAPGAGPVKTLFGPVTADASGAGSHENCDAVVSLRVCAGRPMIERTRTCEDVNCVGADPDLARELDCVPPEVRTTRSFWNGALFEARTP